MEKCLAHCPNLGALKMYFAQSLTFPLPDTVNIGFLHCHFLGCDLLSESPYKLKLVGLLCAHTKELHYLWMAHLRGIDVTSIVAVIC